MPNRRSYPFRTVTDDTSYKDMEMGICLYLSDISPLYSLFFSEIYRPIILSMAVSSSCVKEVFLMP